MGRAARGSVIGAGMLLCGCISTQEPSGTRMFAFDHGGSTYYIVSTDALTGAGNVLLRRDRPFLRADDTDQDGTLDTLLAGDLSLVDANRIYLYGLAEAEARGQRHDRTPVETYTLRLPDGTYAIHMFEGDPPYNRFVIRAAGRPDEIVLLDEGGDGQLDRLERGTGQVDDYQPLYEQVLARGQEEGRIEQRGRRYVVLAEASKTG